MGLPYSIKCPRFLSVEKICFAECEVQHFEMFPAIQQAVHVKNNEPRMKALMVALQKAEEEALTKEQYYEVIIGIEQLLSSSDSSSTLWNMFALLLSKAPKNCKAFHIFLSHMLKIMYRLCFKIQKLFKDL